MQNHSDNEKNEDNDNGEDALEPDRSRMKRKDNQTVWGRTRRGSAKLMNEYRIAA